MKNNVKRIFCLLLALTMVFSMGMPALAEGESEGNGCTGTAECAAQEHNEGCLKAAADAEAAAKAAAEAEAKAKAEAEAAAKANCTGDTGCTAESHNAGCLSQQQEPQHVHAYDAGVVTTDPSCFAEGVKTYTCANAEGCDKLTYTEAIPATGAHNYVDGVCNVEGCGAVEPKTPTCDKSLSCPVTEGHDSDCLKAIQAMIDAVPDVPADFDGVNMPEALKAPSEAYMALSEENKALIDASRLLAWYSPVTTNCCTSYSEENKTHDSACTKTVATANNVGYESLEAAIAAADSTVTLVKSTVLGSTTVIDKSIELDLGRCALTTVSGVTPTAFRITNGASVTVKNGSIDSSTSGAYCFILGASDASSAGNLIIEDGTYKGQTSVVSVTKGKLTIKGGHFSVEPWKNNGVDHYQYLINCIDKYYNKGASIEVTGGSFENFDPFHNAAESNGTNFAASGMASAKDENGYFVIIPGPISDGTNTYATLNDAFNNAASGSTLTLNNDVLLYETAIVPEGKVFTLNLNGNPIYTSPETAVNTPAIRVLGTLIVDGDGSMDSTAHGCYCFIVGNDGTSGSLTIKSGTYRGDTSVASVTKGKLTIEDGHFSVVPWKNNGVDHYQYLINCIDKYYNNGASIEVIGGTFENFDPNNNAAEGAKTDFLSNDMCAVKDGNSFTVQNRIVSLYSGETLKNSYATVEDAIADAAAGDTVKIFSNVSLSAPLSLDKNISIEGVGTDAPTLTYSGKDRAITVENTASGSNLSIKNLKIAAENAERGINYNTNGTLSLDSVTVKAGTYAVNLPSSSDNAKVSIKNSSLTALMALNIWGEKVTATVENSHLLATGSTEKMSYAAIQLNNNGTDIADDTHVTVTGGSVKAQATVEDAKIAVSNWTNTGTVSISDSTVVEGKIVDTIATVNGGGLNSYDEAFEYVGENGTITLLKAPAVASAVVVTKNVTLDAAKLKLTKLSTLTNAFSITAGKTLTVKNWGGTEAELKALVPDYAVTAANGIYTISGKTGFEVNNTSYPTLAQAIENANPGDTVKMFKDESTATPITISKEIKIEGNGHSLTYTGSDRAITVENTASGADLSISNLNLIAGGAERGINYNTNGSLSLSNVSIEAERYGINLPTNSDGGKVSISGCDIEARVPLNVWGSNMEISVTDSDLTVQDPSADEDYSAIQLNNNNPNDVANGTKVTVNGGSLTYVQHDGSNNGPVVSNWTSTGTVSISDSTTVTGDAPQTVVATIGFAGYTTLDEAIADLPAGETIKLIRALNITRSINITRDIKIDLNGNTISKADGVANAFTVEAGKKLTLDYAGSTAPMTMAQVRALVPDYCVTKGSFVIQNHNYSYSTDPANKSRIIESCTNKDADGTACIHKAYAQISTDKASYDYTGSAITPAVVNYSTGNGSDIHSWAGPTNLAAAISYTANIEPAKVTASVTLGNATASVDFSIDKKTYTMTPLSRYIKGSGNSLSFATDITFGNDTVNFDATATPLTISRSGKIVMTLSRGFVLTENTDGTLKITLEPAVMNKLSRTGWYELSAEFYYGTATADFRVIQPLITPTTGDPANFLLWGGLLLGAVAAMGGILVILKKKGKK